MTIEQQIFIVDDDADVRDTLALLLQAAAYRVRCFASAREFLAMAPEGGGCLIADIRMPGMGGLELQEEIARAGLTLPVIFITGHGDVSLAVKAMKSGAVDFIEKPFEGETLLAGVEKALKMGRAWRDREAEALAARTLLAALTPRERDVLEQLVQGRPNKVAAFELGISPRTVEIHRARIMGKMKARSLSDLVRAVLAAGEGRSAPTDRAAAAAPPRRAAAPAPGAPAVSRA